jgi:hypothetical protein
MQVPLDVPRPAEFSAHALKKGYPMHSIIEPCRKEGQASPAQTGVALRDSGCRALVYIFEPSPLSARDFLPYNLSLSHPKRTAPISMMLAPSYSLRIAGPRALGASAETMEVGIRQGCLRSLPWAVRPGSGLAALLGSP